LSEKIADLFFFINYILRGSPQRQVVFSVFSTHSFSFI